MENDGYEKVYPVYDPDPKLKDYQKLMTRKG